MPKRHIGEPRREGTAGRGSRAPRRRGGTRRRAWRRGSLLAVLALALAAGLYSVGQAQAAREPTPEEESASAAKAAEKAAARMQKEEAKATRKAQKQSAKEVREEEAERAKLERRERTNAVVTFSCTKVTWTYRAFMPGSLGNTIAERLTVPGQAIPAQTFEFDGEAGADTMLIDAPAGRHLIDAHGKWDTNGLKGSFDIAGAVVCKPEPGFTIEKLQKLESESVYTTAKLSGTVGQTIDYEIVVRNTGNMVLALSPLVDHQCDEGTLAGGAPSNQLAIGAQAMYTCTHKLDAADLTAGSYTNTVTLTGTPQVEAKHTPKGETDEKPIEQRSNTVEATVTETTPGGGGDGGGGTGNTGNNGGTGNTTTNTPNSGTDANTGSTTPSATTGTTAGTTGKGGVLAFSAASVPALKAPKGCVPSPFKASIKSAGVQSVTFYLDGHKLRTLTAKNASKGLLTITIQASKLRVGAHKLTAKITMTHAAGAKATVGTRTVKVLRCHSAVVTPKFTG